MATPRKIRLKIGVIGLGIIGSRVAANLRAAGHQVYVWSRSPHSAPNFLGSVVEVADLCDFIQIFVSDDAALMDVTRTIAAALVPRHVLSVHATVSPDTARRTASIVEGQGARYLDAPFTGSKAAAQNGQLVYYIGGSEQALGEIRPVLEASSKKILHVGGIGDASVLKIATNMLTAATVQTLAEALALVRSAGIDGTKLAEALESSASRSVTTDMKLPAMLLQDFAPNFSLKHMLKDVRLATELAEKTGVALPVTSATRAVLFRSVEKGWGEEDFSVITRNYGLPSSAEPSPLHLPAAGDVTLPPSEEVLEESPGHAADTQTPAPVDVDAANAPGESEKIPQLISASAGSDEAAIISDSSRAKKSTLRIIRDFFKPEPASQK